MCFDSDVASVGTSHTLAAPTGEAADLEICGCATYIFQHELFCTLDLLGCRVFSSLVAQLGSCSRTQKALNPFLEQVQYVFSEL